MSTDLVDRFVEQVDFGDGDGCWIWTGALNDGRYGRIRTESRRQQLTHRLSYELFVGPIPDGLRCLHRCDVTVCVRPEHLFIGSQADNVADCIAKGRFQTRNKDKTVCKRGHDLTPENTYVYPKGNRQCRTCHRESMRAKRAAGLAA